MSVSVALAVQGGTMRSLDQKTNDEEDLQKLPADDTTPFSPPDDTTDDIPPDYQQLDTNIDEHEWYDEGRTGAAGTHDQEESNAGSRP
jgi:hypothetical protein